MKILPKNLGMVRFLSSRRFWLVVLAFFIVECLWVVFSAQYPMAFDEDFHLGIIKIYAGQWLPFLGHTPAGSQVYGAVTQDPSYLYHYLMSFPYRLVTLFTHDQGAIVIILRLINVGLVVWSIVLFRAALIKATVGHASTNLLLALFVLIPILPLLAGQINYDNLLLLLVAWLLLLVQKIITQMQKNELALGTIIGTFIVCLLTSLVKYAFTPIFLASWIFIVSYILWRYRGAYRTKLMKALVASWRMLNMSKRVMLAVGIVISLSLFVQRYGVNLVVYHSPIPDCSQVLDDASCEQYSPWNRDHSLAQTKTDNDEKSPFVYAGEWLYGMWYRLFFVINGNVDTALRYQNYPPLPIIGIGAIVIFVTGFVAFCFKAKQLLNKNPVYVFYAMITFTYLAILWLQNYKAFLHTGEAVAVNGRYLLLIILPLGALLIVSLKMALKKLPRIQALLAILAIIIFLEGGGIISFIVRSHDGWYWQNVVVNNVNNEAKKIVSPVILGSGESLPIPSP